MALYQLPAPALGRMVPRFAHACLVMLALLASVNAAFAMSGIDAARSLGDMREGHRYNAITAMARTGQIDSPLSASDGAAILQGTTQVSRSAAIAQLASLFKADLSGAEAAAILGAEATLSEGNRYNAITALARAERFGPSLAEDAALALQGTTQVSRAGAIAQIAPHLRPAISGRAVATVLGDARLLAEGNRYNAIAALARSTRAKQPLAPLDVVSILDGTTQVSRAGSIAQLATWIAAGLSGDDAAAILGRGGELTEGNRYNAITALARAGRFRGSLTGDEMAAILQGTTGQSRAAAITQIASAAMRQIASTPIAANPTPLGGSPSPSTTAGTTPTTVGGPVGPNSGAGTPPVATAPSTPATSAATAASIDARIARLRAIASTEPPYLYGSTGLWSDISIVARDLPARTVGFTDYRALYDQLYFSAMQYTGLTSRWIRKAQTAKVSGDLASATRFLDHATTLLQQRQSSFDAAAAAANQDLARATTYVKATYETSKWAARIIARAAGIPGGAAMVDAAGGFIDFALNVQDVGLKHAYGQAFSDALTYAIVMKVPIADLNGRTLEAALQNQTGKLLANAGVIGAIRNGIKDPGVRKVVVDGAKSLLSMPLQGRIEDQIDRALDQLLAVDPATF